MGNDTLEQPDERPVVTTYTSVNATETGNPLQAEVERLKAELTAAQAANAELLRKMDEASRTDILDPNGLLKFWVSQADSNPGASLLAELVRLKEGMTDGACVLCCKSTSSLSGDPGKWPVWFVHPDKTGRVRCHHQGCAADLIAELVQLRERVGKLEKRERVGALAFLMLRSGEFTWEKVDELATGFADTWNEIKVLACPKTVIEPRK